MALLNTFVAMKNTLIYLFLAAITIKTVNAQLNMQWRGLDRSGHYAGEKLPERWPAGGPELLLHVSDLPESYSSVVVKDDIIYTTGVEGDDEILTALNLEGKILWNTIYGKAWEGSFSPARCTPTIEADHAYLISGGGSLACVHLKDGSLAWSVDGYSTFGAAHGTWGTAESPLIIGNRMIYTPCGEQTTVVALDKNTGSTIWSSESINEESSYASPVLMEWAGMQLIVTLTANYVIGMNAADGEILWKLDYSAIDKPMMGGDINPVTPLIKGKEIFVTSGYNHVGVMLELADDCRSVSLKWVSKEMDVHHGGVVEVDGYIYGSNYLNIRNGNWICLDWESGEVMYDQEWQAKGQVITADGKLICYEEKRGNIALVKVTPDGFRPLSEFRVEQGNGPHWSHPSLYQGRLCLRHGKSLLVYQMGEFSGISGR